HAALIEAGSSVGLHLPIPLVGELFEGLTHPLFERFLVPVMLPMGLFNVLGSLQNIESADAAGDPYPALPSLAVNGAGSIVAALFGSCFPTTIYIGHPGWKALGARSGYSILNGVFFTLIAILGLTGLFASLIPLEAGMAIVLWIGVVITAQAHQATPRAHAPAVAIGLFPAIAAWGVLVLTQTLAAAGIASGQADLAASALGQPAAFELAGIHLGGMIALSQGFMLTCVVWSAASACLIDGARLRASAWMLIGALLSFFGFMHAGTLGPSGGQMQIGWASGWRWALGYLLCAAFFAAVSGRPQSEPEPEPEPQPHHPTSNARTG
ncbi:MAG: hypothetical protein OEY14_06260, partial [Myxococcales bacterium]|nr:hypothetical protein [Myxococcales bacterium]